MAEDDDLREQLATCVRILAMQGLMGLYGHVSVYQPKTKRIFISQGAGADRAKTSAQDHYVISLSGEVLEGSGPWPLEWPIHSVIHETRSNALAVAHLHSPYATLFAVAKRELRPVTMPGTIFGDGLPLYSERKLVTSIEQGRQLAMVLGSHRAVLMRSHGIAVVGGSIEEMLYGALVLEDNARTLWQAAALGEIDSFSAEECAVSHGQPQVERGAGLAWQYFCQIEARWDRQPVPTRNPLG